MKWNNLPSRFLSEIDSGFQANVGAMSYESSWSPRQTFNESMHVSKAPVLSNEPRYVPEVNEGDSVRHKLFGVGTIVEKDGDMVTIYFKGKGTKKLDISFAPIEKV